MIARLLILAVALAAAPAAAEVRTYALSGFDSVGLAGQHDAVVTTGPRFAVRAEGRLADLDRLEVKVVGGRLEIGDKRRTGMSWRRGEKVRFAITMPRLAGASVAGSGSLSADRASGQRFAGELAGSGTLSVAALDVREASFEIAGSGVATAAGRCGSGAYEIAGSGQLRAGALRCDTLDVSMAGSGSVDSFARRTAAVSMVGAGDVRVAGGGRCTVSRIGSGKVICPA